MESATDGLTSTLRTILTAARDDSDQDYKLPIRNFRPEPDERFTLYLVRRDGKLSYEVAGTYFQGLEKKECLTPEETAALLRVPGTLSPAAMDEIYEGFARAYPKRHAQESRGLASGSRASSAAPS